MKLNSHFDDDCVYAIVLSGWDGWMGERFEFWIDIFVMLLDTGRQTDRHSPHHLLHIHLNYHVEIDNHDVGADAVVDDNNVWIHSFNSFFCFVYYFVSTISSSIIIIKLNTNKIKKINKIK